ncbi:YALIA101S17e00540g1_1 [Yarrowia lipolytica]|nr:YALIA101S17e00540g1_1 [Yarrowia lipolytica]
MNQPVGIKSPASLADFHQHLDINLSDSCTITGVGTFHLVFEYMSCICDSHYHRVRVLYYDEMTQSQYSSAGSDMIWQKKKSTKPKCEAFTPHLFVCETDNFTRFLIYLTYDWNQMGVTQIDSFKMNYELFEQVDSEPVAPLAKIRTKSTADFTLISREYGMIDVHQVVLEGLWPYFKRLKDQRRDQQEGFVDMKLPLPETTVEMVTRYFYQQPLNMDTYNAAELLSFSQIYSLPDLLTIAVDTIRGAKYMTIKEAVYLWQKSTEVRVDEVADYVALVASSLLPSYFNTVGDSDDENDIDESHDDIDSVWYLDQEHQTIFWKHVTASAKNLSPELELPTPPTTTQKPELTDDYAPRVYTPCM